MAIESAECIKLLLGTILMIFPGYMLSFSVFKKINVVERIVFGWAFSIVVCSLILIFSSVFFKVTAGYFYAIFLLYTVAAIGTFLWKGKKNFSFHIDRKFLLKIIILIGIIIFVFYLTFLPHIKQNYYLPFHGDEWVHWAFTRAFMEDGSIKFTNPFTGQEKLLSPEIGFHVFLASFKWLSTAKLRSIFVFMPSVIAAFTALAAFCIGERGNKKFGLTAALMIAFIPTTVRILGPSFLVPVASGLFFILATLWIAQSEGKIKYVFLPLFILFVLLMHPPSAGAVAIAVFCYAIFRIVEKRYKEGIAIAALSFLPLLAAFAVVRFVKEVHLQAYFEMGIEAIFGTEFRPFLPSVSFSFDPVGEIAIIVFLIACFLAFIKGKSIERGLLLSSIAFLSIIYLYDEYKYGIQIMRDRAFMYEYLMIVMLVGYGIAELGRYAAHLTKLGDYLPKINERIGEKLGLFFALIKTKTASQMLGIFASIIICISILLFALPAHKSLYYQLVTEDEFENYQWLAEHIDEYRNENHSFDKAAIFPRKAGVFSAVTGIHTIASSLWPIYGRNLVDPMYNFFIKGCEDVDFLEKYGLEVIYGACEKDYLVKIHDNIYLYYGMPPDANFSYMPENPKAGEEITFIDNSTTPYGMVNKWLWNFGDGNVSKGEVVGLKFENNSYMKTYVKMNESFTIDMWIQPFFSYDDGKTHEWFYWSARGTYISCLKHSSDRTYVIVKSERQKAVYAVIKFNANEWHHFSAVYNGNAETFYLYWDGKLITAAEGKGSISPGNGVIIIGGRNNRWFNGCIRDVKIYGRDLSGEEVERNYKGNITTDGLIAWWKLGDGNGDIAYDSIGDNDAKIYGAKWVNYGKHVYKKPGEYEVTLTVWNEDGLSDTITRKIVVSG